MTNLASRCTGDRIVYFIQKAVSVIHSSDDAVTDVLHESDVLNINEGDLHFPKTFSLVSIF